MMKYQALKGFAGLVSMRKGDVKELPEAMAAPLLSCGYVVEVPNSKTGRAKQKEKKE